MSSHMCILPHFEILETECDTIVKSVYQHDQKALSLTTAYKLTLTAEALAGVKQFMEVKSVMDTKSVKGKVASEPSSLTA